jgi:allantoinase
VVTAREVLRTDIGIRDYWIVAFSPELNEPAKEVIDATGLHIFPGVIDAHVHFNEPGRSEWEGLETGSRALAAGGGTVFFDMPLNSSPPVLDVDSFNRKRTLAGEKSLADFALWGGLTSGSIAHIDRLCVRGIIGLKAFLCHSGIEDFPRADEKTLREGMKRAVQGKVLVAVHAESEETTRRLAEERIAHGATGKRDYLDSRPVEAELDAIRCALDLAGETKCPLHIVHVSCGEAVALIAEARARGVNVSCETCPHYLTLTEDSFLELGAAAKCAPPLRPKNSQQLLWDRLLAGDVTTVGSDHSPSPPDLKSGEDFFKVWGGISGVQHLLPLLIDEGHHKRGLDLPSIARLTSHNVAVRFNLPPDKGGIKIGADADLAFVNLNAEYEVRREDLLQRHSISPYLGRKLRGKVVRTMIRGQTVFLDGKIVIPKRFNRLIKPVGRL